MAFFPSSVTISSILPVAFVRIVSTLEISTTCRTFGVANGEDSVMVTKPDWFRIVTDYRPSWSRGPTIPFIMGAVRHLWAKLRRHV